MTRPFSGYTPPPTRSTVIWRTRIKSPENPAWELGSVLHRTGVLARHVAAANETALDLAVEACRKLLASRGDDAAKQIDAIIFCTQSQDYIMPANSSLLHARLELPANVF